MATFRRTIANSPLARVAALPMRCAAVARYDSQVVAQSARWLIRSREHTNLTYNLTTLNRQHLAWWVSDVAGVSVETARSYMEELEHDRRLIDHVVGLTRASSRSGLADDVVRFHRNLGWYALVRSLRPEHVIETGTDKGLGSVVLAAALLRNNRGTLTTLDVNPDAGYLIAGPYADVCTIIVGDSIESLRDLVSPVDFFIHDSLHTRHHELAEYAAVAPRLSERAVVLSDNAHATDALLEWAEVNGRRFAYFQERPADHWYPGGGIGVAVQPA